MYVSRHIKFLTFCLQIVHKYNLITRFLTHVLTCLTGASKAVNHKLFL
jgi:hypothetical protein